MKAIESEQVKKETTQLTNHQKKQKS